MNKDLIIYKNMVLTAIKFTLIVCCITVVEILLIGLIYTVANNSYHLVQTLQIVTPILILFFLFLLFYFLEMNYFFLKTKIIDGENDIGIKATKIWQMKESKIISIEKEEELNIPVTVMNFIIPKYYFGKTKYLMSFLPLHQLKIGSTIGSMLNVARMKIPENLREGEVVKIIHGGIKSKKNEKPGDLLLVIKPLKRILNHLIAFVNISILAIVLVVYILIVFKK